MTVSLSGGVTRSEEELAGCEDALGLRLPADYRAFLRQNDGARPADNKFAIPNATSFGVNRFIPIGEVGAERRCIENLPATRVPVAWDNSGNYVCLETGPGAGVFFWDHEEPHIDRRIADSFEEFLERLEPDSLDDVRLDPASVEKAWINPEFLERIKKR